MVEFPKTILNMRNVCRTDDVFCSNPTHAHWELHLQSSAILHNILGKGLGKNSVVEEILVAILAIYKKTKAGAGATPSEHEYLVSYILQ